MNWRARRSIYFFFTQLFLYLLWGLTIWGWSWFLRDTFNKIWSSFNFCGFFFINQVLFWWMLRIIWCISLYFWSIYRCLWDLLFLFWLWVFWLGNNFCLILYNRIFNLLWSVWNWSLTLLISSTLFKFLFFFKSFKFFFLLLLFLNLFLLFSSLFSLLLFKVLFNLQLISFFLCLFSLKLSSISLFRLASKSLQYDFRT